jgi:aromatic ring-opening dioxygenase catalytic subunit (LigB family)
VAARVTELLAAGGIACRQDPARGFDHGTFVPLGLMYPKADVPLVLLSMKSGYDAAEHIRVGQMLSTLREEGILILGSGLTYHNMRGFGNPASTPVATVFEHYLNEAVTQPDAAVRNRMLVDWQHAPSARLAHPREDHLIPLMVVAGAAGADRGARIFVDHVMAVAMASYQFG